MDDRNVIDIDLNSPIYRIVPLDRFMSCLEGTGRDALPNTKRWDDPFEAFFLRSCKVRDPLTGELLGLDHFEKDWYGQCWCLTEESDAMWRIYSKPGAWGVKLRSRVGKVFEHVKDGLPAHVSPRVQFFVGRVRYVTVAQIRREMRGTTLYGATVGANNGGIARLLLVKRTAFAHENEVRFLFNDGADTRVATEADGMAFLDVDPNALYDEVVLDPRLTREETGRMRRLVKDAGYLHRVRRSSLYRTPRFVIDMQ